MKYDFVKSIRMLTDKIKNELNADDPKLDRRNSATPYALRSNIMPNIMSPANKYATANTIPGWKYLKSDRSLQTAAGPEDHAQLLAPVQPVAHLLLAAGRLDEIIAGRRAAVHAKDTAGNRSAARRGARLGNAGLSPADGAQRRHDGGARRETILQQRVQEVHAAAGRVLPGGSVPCGRTDRADRLLGGVARVEQ